jgi:hypothetical protein
MVVIILTDQLVDPSDSIDYLAEEAAIKWNIPQRYDIHFYTRDSSVDFLWTPMEDEDKIQRAILNSGQDHAIDTVFSDNNSHANYVLLLFKHCNDKQKGLVIGSSFKFQVFH